MSEPNGYLIHGTAFSSKEAAFKALVSNHDQESWFHKIWDKDAQPYYFESQPQLTIPKSIADLADKEAFADSHTKFKIFIERYELNRLDRHLNLYCCTEEGRETIFAYMNPSTRDLVKVVEG